MGNLCQGKSGGGTDLRTSSLTAEERTSPFQDVEQRLHPGRLSDLPQSLATSHHQSRILCTLQKRCDRFNDPLWLKPSQTRNRIGGQSDIRASGIIQEEVYDLRSVQALCEFKGGLTDLRILAFDRKDEFCFQIPCHGVDDLEDSELFRRIAPQDQLLFKKITCLRSQLSEQADGNLPRPQILFFLDDVDEKGKRDLPQAAEQSGSIFLAGCFGGF